MMLIATRSGEGAVWRRGMVDVSLVDVTAGPERVMAGYFNVIYIYETSDDGLEETIDEAEAVFETREQQESIRMARIERQ